MAAVPVQILGKPFVQGPLPDVWDAEEMYIAVDKGVCTACGSCQATCPEVFSYDKKFLGYNLLDDNTGTTPIPKVLWKDAYKLRFCPPRAIKFSPTPFVNFTPTPEFGDESPLNPNITYELGDDEWVADEL